LLVLAWRVVRLRQREQIGLGDGGHPELQRATRVHANFTEYVPLALVMLLAFEVAGGPAALTHAFGAVLLIGRVLHAQGLGSHSGYSKGRFLGTLLTWGVVAGLGLALVGRGVWGAVG
jgi:uncharacterized membrane protein YecN with MAPEG domain